MPAAKKNIELTPHELAELVRNGENRSRFDWQGWIKVGLVCLLPFIALITFINGIEGNINLLAGIIERHEKWIESHTKDTTALKDAVHAVESKQGVILEKVSRAQQDVEQLLKESRDK